MRIEKIKNSNLLQSGQLLVVAKFWRLPNSGLESGPVQYYRHRLEPVSWIRRSKNGSLFCDPRTTSERKANSDTLEKDGVVFSFRGKRKSDRLPGAFDDQCLRYQRSLKKYRRMQLKDKAEINRRIHNAPYWGLATIQFGPSSGRVCGFAWLAPSLGR
jgi:hypothetical protein